MSVVWSDQQTDNWSSVVVVLHHTVLLEMNGWKAGLEMLLMMNGYEAGLGVLLIMNGWEAGLEVLLMMNGWEAGQPRLDVVHHLTSSELRASDKCWHTLRAPAQHHIT